MGPFYPKFLKKGEKTASTIYTSTEYHRQRQGSLTGTENLFSRPELADAHVFISHISFPSFLLLSLPQPPIVDTNWSRLTLQNVCCLSPVNIPNRYYTVAGNLIAQSTAI